MKIVSPISRLDEVAPLAAAGADELYCGVVPRAWVERFQNAGVNRRVFGNLRDEDELAAVIGAAHAAGSTVSMVLNAQHYSGAQVQALLDLARMFAELGGDAVIVGDLALLVQLAALGLPLRLHVSSLLSCRNAEAARLYSDLGAHRIVLPRDLGLSEIEAMAAALPNIELEAFILNDGCVFEEGSCHTIHLPGRLGGAICLDTYQCDSWRVDGKPLDARERAAFADNDARYRDWLHQRFSCGFSTTAEGYPYGPCGLCALPRLAAAGIAAVKIAGREAGTPRKQKSVEMVAGTRRVLDGAGGEAAIEFARGLRGRPDLCGGGFMCYYRETAADAAGPVTAAAQ